MPYLRFSRDKRGYEHFYLVQPVAARRGKSMQHRILYWYRSPPNVKVGREPFDEDVQRALEAQNPGVEFDWEKIRATPFPPVQPEPWRDRRRAEKAARQQAKEEDEREASADAPLDTPEEAASVASPMDPVAERLPDEPLNVPDADPSAEAIAAGAVGHPTGTEARRRRRRRRGRQGRGRVQGSAPGGETAEGAPSTSVESDVPPDNSAPDDGDEVPGH